MPGRPDFSQAGSGGSGQTVAVTNRPEIESLDVSRTTSVASGISEVTEVYAPAGSLYRGVGMELDVYPDSNATSGDHTFVTRPQDHLTMHFGRSDYATRVTFARMAWLNANVSSNPTGEEVTVTRALTATENTPLVIKYLNNTDAAQDNTRTQKLVVEEVSY